MWPSEPIPSMMRSPVGASVLHSTTASSTFTATRWRGDRTASGAVRRGVGGVYLGLSLVSNFLPRGLLQRSRGGMEGG